MNNFNPFKNSFFYKNCNERGFTLVEVLVALTIFAVGLLGLAGMQITGLQGNSRAQSVSAKVALADGVIEEFLAMKGDNPLLITEVTDIAWVNATNIDINGAGTCSATVTVDADPVIGTVTYTDLTQIQVTVSNQLGSDVTKTVMKRRY